MEISRKTDYAIRLVAALMLNEGKPLSVRMAAEMQDVPYSFARSIQRDLTQGGIITTIRGAYGGMVLTVDPKQYTLTQLIETLQGPISLAVCLSEDGWCPRDESCAFHGVWATASQLLRDYLSSVTMQDILEGKHPSVLQARG